MNLINVIPIGKKYKQTRQQLMSQAKIIDTKVFQEELAKLKKHYIIAYDNGYYLPSSKKEYLEIIQKQTEQLYNISKILNIAYKEMEELDNV